MEQFFKDKNIVITGGGSGIGASLARQLTSYGAMVIVVGRSPTENTESYIQADMAQFKEAKSAFEQAIARMPRLDYVINSAGIFMGGEIRDTPIENWHTVIDNNIYAVAHGAHLAYQHMIQQKSGHIINITSTAGLIPVPAMGIYGATKYALVGLSHAMRNEGAALGVKVSVACPTVVNTPLYDTAIYNNLDVRRALQSRKKFQSPDAAAQKILQGIWRNQATIHTSAKTMLVWRFYKLFPGLYDRIARKVMNSYRTTLRLK